VSLVMVHINPLILITGLQLASNGTLLTRLTVSVFSLQGHEVLWLAKALENEGLSTQFALPDIDDKGTTIPVLLMMMLDAT